MNTKQFPKIISLIAILVIGVFTPVQGFDPGRNGNLVVNNSQTVVVNPTAILLHQSANQGATQVRQDPDQNVGNVLGLQVGDLIMIYQAQGAAIQDVDTWQYGSITNLNGAGRYELASVTTVPVFNGPPGSRGFIGISTACGGLQNSYNISQA
ncbi:MAG: hypothetical protein JJU11_15380, partial [Candidatus Sumerlaeia bacterium]|nr:hypothetical protein [Candidatus Sumerlaeia bacterium]